MTIRDFRTSSHAQSSTLAQSRFATVPSTQIPRSVFNRSCALTTTFDSSFLIPIFVEEALPGDTFSLRMSHFTRMATPLYPVMDNMYIDFFFFAVPNRLLWDNWQKFNGEQENPGDHTDYSIPQIESGQGWAEDSMEDYFGLPTKVPDLSVSALWHRSYNLVYTEWFRPQDLINRPAINRGDGPDDLGDYKLLRRSKRHDYFTSALPFAQKGPAVELPLGTAAPVIGTAPVYGDGTSPIQMNTNDLDVKLMGSFAGVTEGLNPAGNWNDANQAASFADSAQGLLFDSERLGNNMFADLSSATAATINQIREAFQIQRMFEKDARGGSRYTEILRSHFQISSPDQRLQRPEYLGGGSTKINVNPVAATVSGGGVGQEQLGDLGAFVTAGGQGVGFMKSFVEHCTIIGLASIRADLKYQQGIERMWSRKTRFDFYWPSLAHLGEQEIISKEIYADGTGDPDELTGDYSIFGYQERYAEYRYKPSKITGRMRSNSDQPLDQWHLAQFFESRPLLNDLFIEEDVPVDRVLAVTEGEPQFLFDAFFNYRCARPMPTVSVPGLIDHF